jgi:Ca2+-binding RTX toxin-like protein
MPGGSVSGNVDGGVGSNTLDYSNLPGPVAVDLQTATATDIGGTFIHIGSFIGSAGSDTFTGPDADSTWTLSGPNSGSVAGVTYASFENLVGGAGNDRFVFLAGGSISGNLDGGPGTNILDYSNLTTPVTLDLQTHSATGIGGSFMNIQGLIGGQGINTLIGPDSNSVWTLTGLNAGNVAGFTFGSFQNLVGGSGDDRFVFLTGAGVSGSIDGGGGTNTLDYSQDVGDVVVDLLLGAATGVGQGVKNIQNLVGSIGNDLFVGTPGPNTFQGGTGRSVFIGGGGGDRLIGGTGDSLLIAGTTAWDTNLVALEAILAEWSRTDLSFEQRVADLISDAPPSRALNGPYMLNKKTVFADDTPDVLIGGGGMDWFFADNKDDTIQNKKPGDHTTNL